jgi:hypothetical protein
MAYGDPIAVRSEYGDTILCLSCANVIYRLAECLGIAPQRESVKFWVWMRDLKMEEAAQTLYGENEQQQYTDEKAFANEVYRGRWIDPESAMGNKLVLLREGHAGEQEELNDGYCDKCLKAFVELCHDYP